MIKLDLGPSLIYLANVNWTKKDLLLLGCLARPGWCAFL